MLMKVMQWQHFGNRKSVNPNKLCGYEPVNPNELNWNYCISKKSSAFTDK